ncbi:translation initiation factor IF-2-like [Panthera pardus]|uniref:Translation initiation factor IF-2-like n=1 Tax=Panthera pardus TaxID=9691 RepID=A0A9W2VYI0_PANPR|nr:translation initiation factor IF-2-like [Panthera pardus]
MARPRGGCSSLRSSHCGPSTSPTPGRGGPARSPLQGAGRGPRKRNRSGAAPQPFRSPIQGGVAEKTVAGPPTRGAPQPGCGARVRLKSYLRRVGRAQEEFPRPEADGRRFVSLQSGSEEEMGSAAPPPPARGPGPARPSRHLPPARSSRRLPPSPRFPGPRLGGEVPTERRWRRRGGTPRRTSCSPPFTPELLHPKAPVGFRAGSDTHPRSEK